MVCVASKLVYIYVYMEYYLVLDAGLAKDWFIAALPRVLKRSYRTPHGRGKADEDTSGIIRHALSTIQTARWDVRAHAGSDLALSGAGVLAQMGIDTVSISSVRVFGWL